MADLIRFEGTRDEHYARLYLKDKGYNIFGPDWITEKEGKYCIIEVKHKNRPFAPYNDTFKGHGLDYSQVKTRMNFYKKTGIPTLLIIFDASNNKIYKQYLHILEASKSERKRYLGNSKIQVYDLCLYDVEEQEYGSA